MILYHYTTAVGLEGIVSSKSIWCSDYRFLNDRMEFNYGLSIFDKVFNSNIANSIHPDIQHIVGDFRMASSNFSLMIASFCRHPDLLSQWRGYNGGIGYAIGLNDDWLNQNALAQGFQLVPVCYSPLEQQKLIQDKIGLLRTLVLEKQHLAPIWELTRDWWGHLLLTLAALKDESFKEEDEYRLVQATVGWPGGIAVRAAPQGLVPYKAMRLDFKVINSPQFFAQNSGIESVVVGPGLREQQCLAVDALLASRRMRVHIGKSAIPFLPI